MASQPLMEFKRAPFPFNVELPPPTASFRRNLKRAANDMWQDRDPDRLISVANGQEICRTRNARCPACGKPAVQVTRQEFVRIRQGDQMVGGPIRQDTICRRFFRYEHKCRACGCNPLRIRHTRRRHLLECAFEDD